MMIWKKCRKENEPWVKLCAFYREPAEVADDEIKVVTSDVLNSEAVEDDAEKGNDENDNSSNEVISSKDEKIATLRKYKE